MTALPECWQSCRHNDNHDIMVATIRAWWQPYQHPANHATMITIMLVCWQPSKHDENHASMITTMSVWWQTCLNLAILNLYVGKTNTFGCRKPPHLAAENLHIWLQKIYTFCRRKCTHFITKIPRWSDNLVYQLCYMGSNMTTKRLKLYFSVFKQLQLLERIK